MLMSVYMGARMTVCEDSDMLVELAAALYVSTKTSMRRVHRMS